MKPRHLLLALAACAACALLIPTDKPAAAPAAEPPARELRNSARRVLRDVPPAQATVATADPAWVEQASAVIHEAMATYAPSGVHPIRPFLLDSDPAIRQAARDGLVQLGEADAIPFLRAAAAKLQNPAEIASFHEAADLLALPAWSDSAEARAAIAEITGENPP